MCVVDNRRYYFMSVVCAAVERLPHISIQPVLRLWLRRIQLRFVGTLRSAIYRTGRHTRQVESKCHHAQQFRRQGHRSVRQLRREWRQ